MVKRHGVRAHTRQGRPVRSYTRGRGASQVKPTLKKMHHDRPEWDFVLDEVQKSRYDWEVTIAKSKGGIISSAHDRYDRMFMIRHGPKKYEQWIVEIYLPDISDVSIDLHPNLPVYRISVFHTEGEEGRMVGAEALEFTEEALKNVPKLGGANRLQVLLSDDDPVESLGYFMASRGTSTGWKTEA